MHCHRCGGRMVHICDGGMWFWVCACGNTLLPVPTQQRMPGS